MRLHGFLRDQHMIAGLGRMLANEVCHRAKLSPFAMTGKLGAEGAHQVRATRSTRASTTGWRTSARGAT
jgi:formamidopyrimidine-DNA glycosylase